MKRNKPRGRFSTPQEVFQALLKGEVKKQTMHAYITPSSTNSPEYKNIIREGLNLYRKYILEEKLKKLEQEGYE